MFLPTWLRFERGAARLNARWGKPAAQVLRWVVPIALLAFLARGFTQIGWSHVWEARPSAPSFYLALFLPFFIQPVADLIIYRKLLNVGRLLPLSVLLRKRYLNGVMLEYSGEAYFFLWAQKNLNLRKGLLLHAVKDSNVLSAGAGLVMVWLMLLALVATGDFKLPAFVMGNVWTIGTIGSLPFILCVALIVGGRRVTALTRREVAGTFAVHLTRSLVALLLDFAIWWLSGALPSAAVCVAFVGFRLLLTRLPLVPNKDLLFVGLGLEAAGWMDVSAPAVAAVLVITTAFNQLMEFAVVGLPWLVDQFRVSHGADQASS